ncbi:MAG: BON domain-containing protein [Rubripirellula sp.]
MFYRIKIRRFAENGIHACAVSVFWVIFLGAATHDSSGSETSDRARHLSESLEETRESTPQTQDIPVLNNQGANKLPSLGTPFARLLSDYKFSGDRPLPDATDAEADDNPQEKKSVNGEPSGGGDALLTTDDKRLRASVVKLLQRKMSEGKLRNFGVRVACREGSILLSGEVQSREQRETLILCVRSVPGVIDTIADLTINNTSPSAADPTGEARLEETELIELAPPNRLQANQEDFKSYDHSASGSGVRNSTASNLGESYIGMPEPNRSSAFSNGSLRLSKTGSGIPAESQNAGISTRENRDQGRSLQSSPLPPEPSKRMFATMRAPTAARLMEVSPAQRNAGLASSNHSISSLTPNGTTVGAQVPDSLDTVMRSTDPEPIPAPEPEPSLQWANGTSDFMPTAMVGEPARQQPSSLRPFQRILRCGQASGKAVCSLCQCLGRFTCSCCAQEELTFGTEGTYLGVIGEGNNQLVIIDDLTGETAVSDSQIGFAAGQRFWLGVQDSGVGIVGKYWLLGSRLIDATFAYVPPSDIAFQSNYMLDLQVFDLLYFHEFCCNGCTLRASLGGRYADLDRAITLTASGKSGGIFINGNTRSNYDSDGFGGVAILAGSTPICWLGAKRANSNWSFFWEFAGSILQTNAEVQGRSAVNAFHSNGSSEFSNSVDEDHVFWDGITANGMMQLGIARTFAFPNKKCFGNLFFGFEGHIWETAGIEVNTLSQASTEVQGSEDLGGSIRGATLTNPNNLALAGFVWGVSVVH